MKVYTTGSFCQINVKISSWVHITQHKIHTTKLTTLLHFDNQNIVSIPHRTIILISTNT